MHSLKEAQREAEVRVQEAGGINPSLADASAKGGRRRPLQIAALKITNSFNNEVIAALNFKYMQSICLSL